jgi:NAD(P)-dependent dehydrogenase (short-subunit alcohol dehydrogenase family)
VTYRRLEQGDAESISELARDVGPVDVLVNNAGRAQGGALEDVPAPAIEDLFRINVFGPVALTREFLPGMRKNGWGRIIFIGSLSAEFHLPFLGSYTATKLALRGFAACLRSEVSPFGVSVSVVDPGYFRTRLDVRREWFTAEGSPYSGQFTSFVQRVRSLSGGGQDPVRAAERVWRTATARKPPLLTSVGSGAPAVVIGARMIPPRLLERLLYRHFGLTAASS